ncbi:hypothetical protein A9Q99_14065 [Gammaproteobacteria bacterium 45_16_T64]|nr:hypothetical protein A9Q99_14065 [Gammaproteobacteria bacterium 45_16_T64]
MLKLTNVKNRLIEKVNAKKKLMMIPIILATNVMIAPVAVADFYISSFGTNEVMRFNEDTGDFLGVIAGVDGPFASQIGFNGDLFVASFNTGEVLRYNSKTGEYLGVFIESGEGGLTNPTAPNFGPDGLVYVGDLANNQVIRFDEDGKFIDVFADAATSDLDGPFMQTFDDDYMYIASGYTNSILRYDLETKEYLGAFVPPGSGGVVVPVGLEFGPDGNLYTSSSGTSAVIRYDGKTGEFIDVFVPPGSGGMDSPRAIRFGGENSDLYVVSSNTNNILHYDRVTGEFIDVIANDIPSGFVAPRGLTFSPRPEFLVDACPAVVVDSEEQFTKIKVHRRISDFTDRRPKVELVSITVNDPDLDIDDLVKNARFGERDMKFKLDTLNDSDTDRIYTITYTATNKDGAHTLATSTVTVPSSTVSDDEGDDDNSD